MLTQKYDPELVVPKLTPICLSTNGLKHKLEPVENEGWYVLLFIPCSISGKLMRKGKLELEGKSTN
jgi:hypothetical protein